MQQEFRTTPSLGSKSVNQTQREYNDPAAPASKRPRVGEAPNENGSEGVETLVFSDQAPEPPEAYTETLTLTKEFVPSPPRPGASIEDRPAEFDPKVYDGKSCSSIISYGTDLAGTHIIGCPFPLGDDEVPKKAPRTDEERAAFRRKHGLNTCESQRSRLFVDFLTLRS